nr:probable inactive protein kinase DDB_G0270444 isoform X1 [Ipomoea batatas]
MLGRSNSPSERSGEGRTTCSRFVRGPNNCCAAFQSLRTRIWTRMQSLPSEAILDLYHRCCRTIDWRREVGDVVNKHCCAVFSIQEPNKPELSLRTRMRSLPTDVDPDLYRQTIGWREEVGGVVHKHRLHRRCPSDRRATLSISTTIGGIVERRRPDVIAKSEQQRKNRMSEVAGPGTGCSRHTGGSRYAIEHYHKLEEIQTRHDAATQEVEGSSEPPVINMSQLYVDVVGGVKKQRIYGLGTKASSFINDNSCSSYATSQFHQDTMKEMLDTMRVEMEAQMEAKLQAERTQMQAKLQDERTQMETQMQAQIASLMDELRRNGVIPTTSTPQPPTTEGHSVNSNDEDLGDD